VNRPPGKSGLCSPRAPRIAQRARMDHGIRQAASADVPRFAEVTDAAYRPWIERIEGVRGGAGLPARVADALAKLAPGVERIVHTPLSGHEALWG
jgi:hypothetical protein